MTDAAFNRLGKRSAYLPFAALALLALIWGYNWVVMKVGVQYSDPFTFAALRNFLGGLALFGGRGSAAAARSGPGPSGCIALFGVFQTSLSGLLGVGSLPRQRRQDLGAHLHHAVLAAADRLAGAWASGSEALQWVAVVLALAGLVFVLDPWRLHGLAAGLLAVAGGLCWAIASVLFKIIRKRHEVEILLVHGLAGADRLDPPDHRRLRDGRPGPTWNASFIAALRLQRPSWPARSPGCSGCTSFTACRPASPASAAWPSRWWECWRRGSSLASGREPSKPSASASSSPLWPC